MRHALLVAWAVLMLSGCAAHSVSVDGGNIHVSFYGIDVADVNLPQNCKYIGKIKIGLSPDGAVPSFLRYYQCGESYFGISTAIVEKVDFYDKADSPYVYSFKIGRNSVPFDIDKISSYKIRSIVKYYPEDKLLFKCIYSNKEINYIVVMYWEDTSGNQIVTSLPKEENELTPEQMIAIQQFEARADKLLSSVILH